MTQPHLRRLREVFEQACERSGPERARFLDQACRGDDRLRAEVDSLLAAHEEADGFLDSPAADPLLGTTVGGYRVREILGRGGMGVIYRATQDRPRRDVALKLLGRGTVSPALLRRFEVEAEVLGRLQHPGIAQIVEAGTADTGHGPQPFFAMELIDGLSLTAYAEQHELDRRRRLELMIGICDAVQHAHQKGVIHRDLKPANILVDRSGQPKVLDFGVARATDADLQCTTALTDVGMLIGTLRYMSPEQVRGATSELDTRSDVYALGVVCYELLTGRLPHDLSERTITESIRIIAEEPPQSLSAPGESFPIDLETIVAKALAQDHARRYASASELAADLGRFLDNEPIAARPPSATYQLRKLVSRHRLAFGMAALLSVSLLGFAIAMAVQAHRLAKSRAEVAVEARTARQVSEFLENLFVLSEPARARGETITAREILDEGAARLETELAEQPLVQARLFNIVGTVYRRMGMNREAEPLLRRALSQRRELLGEDHPDSLASLNDLAATLLEGGQLEEAETDLQQALERRRRVLGEDHPETLTSCLNLGLVIAIRGRFEEAEPYHREALEGRLRILGDDDPVTLDTISAYGQLLEKQGRLEEAERHIRQALAGQTAVLGGDHLDTLDSSMRLGSLLVLQQRWDEAEPHLLGAVDGLRRVAGEDHRSTLSAIHSLGTLFYFRQQFDKAEPIWREALELRRQALGPDHPDTLDSLNGMGALYYAMDRLEEAEPYLSEALASRRRLLGDDHPETLASIGNMGALLSQLGRDEQAEAHFREAFEGYRRVLGDDHPNTVVWRDNLAIQLEATGQAEEAASLRNAS